MIEKENAVRFLNDFALPCAEKIIEEYLDGNVPKHSWLAKKQIIPHNAGGQVDT